MISIYLTTSVVLLIFARKFIKYDGAIKFIVIGQLSFMFLGLVVRPIVLFLKQPNPEFGDAFADARLIVSGSYNLALQQIGIHILFGVLTYCLFLAKFEKLAKFKVQSSVDLKNQLKTLPIFLFLVVTFIANLLEYTGIIQSRFLTWISVAALPCAGIALQAIMLNYSEFLTRILLTSIVAAHSLGVSILMESKSPIFFFLFVLIFVNVTDRDQNRKKFFSVKYLSFGGLVVASGYFLFTYVQSIKDGDELTSLNSEIGQKYFGRIPSIYTVLKRFDLFRAVSDVWYVGEGYWYSFSGFIRIMFESMEWNFGSLAPNFGGQWAINVLHRSPNTEFSPVVSLSQSAVAEGWLLGGYIGIVFTTMTLAMITVAIAKMIDATLFLKCVGFYVIGSNSIFEGGVVANLESISTGVRTAIIIWMAISVLNATSNNRSLPGRAVTINAKT